MVLKTSIVLIFVLFVLGEARHLHPRIEQWDPSEQRVITLNTEIGTTETDAIKVQPKKLSPLSILFFKSYDPCEDGYKLDFRGICRDVWY